MSEPEERLDQLFLTAFETNEAAMLDWVQIKFQLKAARALETQRDEARAEVERLRKALRRLAAIASGGTINHAFVERVAAEACGDPDTYPVFAEKLAEMAANKPTEATQPEIFEAHGLEWYRHTPGDKMPCDGEMMVELFTNQDGGYYLRVGIPARLAWWKDGTKGSRNLIIGWRPADAPEKLERKGDER